MHNESKTRPVRYPLRCGYIGFLGIFHREFRYYLIYVLRKWLNEHMCVGRTGHMGNFDVGRPLRGQIRIEVRGHSFQKLII